MATENNDIIGHLMQDIFKEPQGIKYLLEQILRLVMQEEVTDHIRADSYERTSHRRGRRNGYKPRSLKSRIGKLDLLIPQVRDCPPYQPTMFNRWQRSERALLITCAEMYFQGVSTRRVQNVLEVMCGTDISSATVSRVAQELDQKLTIFRNRLLADNEFPYLQIDARYEKVRVDSIIISQAALVCAGIDITGHRHILDWRIADSESEDSWGDMFKGLKERGLRGLKLITSDAHSGIRSATTRYFQGVEWQRCRVHFKRELLKKVLWKDSKQIMKDIAWVFEPESRNECMLRGMAMADKWRKRYPSVSKMLEDGLEDCLTICSYDEAVQKKMSSTNLLESIMKQLKARTQVVGIFPNRQSCDRLTGSLLLEIHEKWQAEETPYMRLPQ